MIRPPADQAGFDRLGLFYFLRPENKAPMIPAPSPVLRREGLLAEEDGDGVVNDVVNGYGVSELAFSSQRLT